MDLGRTTGKIKRQRRHSKKEKVEKVFWCGNSEEIKKNRKCQNEPAQIFKEKSFLIKKGRNISPFQKKQKVQTNEKHCFSKNKSM